MANLFHSLFKPRTNNTREDIQDPSSVHEQRNSTFMKRIFPNGYKDEAKQLLSLAIPTTLTLWCQFLTQSISVMMCGRLSRREFDAVSLANSIINISGIAIAMGLTSACDTFFSQTYGSGNKKRMGMHLQKSFMVVNLFLFPIFAFHINIEPVLYRLLGQNKEISEKAATYITLFLPGLFFNFNFEILARYLQNQNSVYPPLICAFVANIYNALSQYVAIHVLNYGFKASAVCQASSMFLMFVFLLIYILGSGVAKPTWAGWTIESFYDWGSFFKLALPGIFFIGLEAWCYEVLIFVAGLFNDIQMGAQSVLLQISVNMTLIPMGLAVALNIRVGQQVGDFKKDGAITSYRIALSFIGFTSFFLIIIFLAMPSYVAMIFTKDIEIIAVVAKIMPIFAFYQPIDGLNTCSIAVLWGCGRQLFGAVVMFVAYYVIGLPIEIPVTLWSGLQIQGAWLVLFCVTFCEAVFLSLVIYFQNWDQYCVEAQIRAFGRITEQPLKMQDNLSTLESKEIYDEKTALHNFFESDPSFATFDPTKFSQVLCHRIGILILCVLILAIGVLLRVTLPLYWSDGCISLMNNSTFKDNKNESILSIVLPRCNGTL